MPRILVPPSHTKLRGGSPSKETAGWGSSPFQRTGSEAPKAWAALPTRGSQPHVAPSCARGSPGGAELKPAPKAAFNPNPARGPGSLAQQPTLRGVPGTTPHSTPARGG